MQSRQKVCLQDVVVTGSTKADWQIAHDYGVPSASEGSYPYKSCWRDMTLHSHQVRIDVLDIVVDDLGCESIAGHEPGLLLGDDLRGEDEKGGRSDSGDLRRDGPGL
jgi:hypothetical protein